MKILGLDVASIDTGWAVLVFSGDGPPSLLDWGLIHQPSGWKVGKKLYTFRNSLRDVVHAANADEVVVERPFIKNRTAVEAIYRFHGATSLVVYEIMEKEVVNVAVDRIRSILGVSVKKKKGGPKPDPKRPALDLVNKKFGTEFTEKQYDITDAIATGWAGYSEIMAERRKRK